MKGREEAVESRDRALAGGTEREKPKAEGC